MPSAIELREVCVDARGGSRILDGVTLKIAGGESVAFIGRSGAGKTTALRLINGLVRPSRGEVLIDGVPLGSTDLIALRRRTGYIIQGSGLFPHRSVYDNVATIPRLLRWPEGDTRAAADEADPIVRRELQDAFRSTRARGDATIVFVTHDLAEALHVAERVIVFDGGRVVEDVPAGSFTKSAAPVAQALMEASRW